MANVFQVTWRAIPNVLVTEPRPSVGYNTLVSDMRALPILARTGAPVIFDATHRCSSRAGQGASSGGEREFVPALARAAVAVGRRGCVHRDPSGPDRAPSDGPNMIPIKQLERLLQSLMQFDAIAKKPSA
jgi:2-dehydro-3-deoxyphosphooctonate aldolase (KDO 8-P synthase)